MQLAQLRLGSFTGCSAPDPLHTARQNGFDASAPRLKDLRQINHQAKDGKTSEEIGLFALSDAGCLI